MSLSKTLNLLKISIVSLLLLACGVFVGNPSDDEDENKAKISGSVFFGPVDDATIEVFELESDGTRGKKLTSTKSTDGVWSIEIPTTDYPVEIVSKSGNYLDEASGVSVSLSANGELSAIISSFENRDHIAINPVTHFMAKYVRKNAGSKVSEIIGQANDTFATQFGLGTVSLVDIKPVDLTKPSDDNASLTDGVKMGMIMAGFSQVALNAGLTEDLELLVQSIAIDFSDGNLNLKVFDEELASDQITNLSPFDAISSLESAISQFLSGDKNKSKFNEPSISIPVPPSGSGGVGLNLRGNRSE